MTTSWRIAIVVAFLAAACSGGTPHGNPLLSGIEPPLPEGVQEGCDLAQVKCTSCHTVERILRARVKDPSHWVHYVKRMKLQPGSGIGGADEKPLVRCLVYRSFGADGLQQIEQGASE